MLNSTRLFIVVLSLLFSCIVHSDQTNSYSQDVTQYKLLVLGDSLSAAYGLRAEQGWVALLKQQWEQENVPITIVNAAISGDTTDGGLARLPRLLDLHKPSHLYLELGGNNGLQGHNPQIIKQNLIQIVELAQQNDVEVLIQEMQIPTNYGTRYTRSFNAIFHDVAQQFKLPLIPFFLQDMALNADLMQRDGIHPTAEAQPLIVSFLSPLLENAVLEHAE